MSQGDKAAYWAALKNEGVEFKKHYRDYTTEELKLSWEAVERDRHAAAVASGLVPSEDTEPSEPLQDLQAATEMIAQAGTRRERHMPVPPQAEKDVDELPGQRLNTKPEDEPIRTDENGLVWYQEEVQKAAFAKPRGRRVMKYMDPGVAEQSTVNGQYQETFEVGGTRQIPSEVKITLPSYQVGIYKDPRFPFKVHVYNGITGFDLFEVQEFYGGAELVPAEIKRMYVENVLCYDIRSVIRAIETEHRQLMLAGKV